MGDFDVTFTVHGEPASKANSRKMVLIKGRPALIKSQKARDYVKTFEQQCPVLEVQTTDDVVVEILMVDFLNDQCHVTVRLYQVNSNLVDFHLVRT